MALLVCAVCTDTVQGAPLDLTLQPSPSIFSDAIDVNYNSTTQTFIASGFAEHIHNATAAPLSIVNGQFEIAATIAQDGSFRDGTLTITGEVPSLGISQGKLLVGKLSSLGYGVAGGAVEFKFATTDGALFYQYGPETKVILGQSGFAGSFSRNFSNGAIGVASIGW